MYIYIYTHFTLIYLYIYTYILSVRYNMSTFTLDMHMTVQPEQFVDASNFRTLGVW